MVTIQIAKDPHNPNQVPRIERAANIDAAVSAAMVNGWSCSVVYTARTPTDKDRTVTLEDGKLTSAEPNGDLDYWIAASKRHY